jgi:hypothetical protein
MLVFSFHRRVRASRACLRIGVEGKLHASAESGTGRGADLERYSAALQRLHQGRRRGGE